MTKITLADGTAVEFSGINGNNFIVPDKKEMDVSIFTDENLKNGSVKTDDGTMYEFENLRFTQQQKQKSGDYYICFHEMTDEEKMSEIKDLLVQLAEIDVSDGNLELADIKGTLQDAVRVKIDDDKWIDK